MDKNLVGQFDIQRRKVDVDNFDVTVRELVRMVNDKEIDRAAEYQRKFRWDEERESRLVESVLLGLPVPTIFVATNKDGTWELVDGLQRISSLVHFVSDPKNSYKTVGKSEPLKLSGLTKLDEFNGLGYEDLPEPIKLQFMKRALRVTSLSDKSDLDVRFDTFERLNTGGIVLSPQEIRGCIFRKDFIELLESLASDKYLKQLIKLQKGHREDGTLEEFVLKIFAYADDIGAFDGKVTFFLNEYAKKIQGSFDAKVMSDNFQKVTKLLGSKIDGPILKKDYSVTPLNLAEGIFVACLHLVRSNKRIKPKDGWLRDKQLIDFSTGGTNTRRSLTGRIERAQKLLQGATPDVG